MRIAADVFVRSSVILAAALLSFGTAADVRPENALADYVGAEDESYAWRIHARHEVPGAQIVELRLHSQTWRGTLWKHRLHVIRPEGIEEAEQALLVIAGGRWRERYEIETEPAVDDDAPLFVSIAQRLETVVAVVSQVPFQPIFGLREDELIAHTFEQYLATGEGDWPLLLPMVKAAARAMDATQEFASAEWRIDVDRFTVLGGSKRGWTTWLTGAVDSRAAALVPIVIDVLNFEAHMPHQEAMWGEPSAQIAPYTRRNLDDALSSEAGSALRTIVDPYSYRERLAQPKLIVVATNDPYFPLDSLNLYWPDLVGPKSALYLPNEGHGAEDFARLIPALDAVHRLSAEGRAPPSLEWALERGAGGELRLCVRSDPAPIAVTVWSADSEETDFRDEQFVPAAAAAHGGVFVGHVDPPSEGVTAVFAEALLDGPNGRYLLSTNVSLIDETGEPPRSAAAVRGGTGVCP